VIGILCTRVVSTYSTWQVGYRLVWDVLNMSICFKKCVLPHLNMMVFFCSLISSFKCPVHMFLVMKYGTEHTKLLHSTLLYMAKVLPVSHFITVGRMFPSCAQTLHTVPLNMYIQNCIGALCPSFRNSTVKFDMQ
jgi:hypothetical protein